MLDKNKSLGMGIIAIFFGALIFIFYSNNADNGGIVNPQVENPLLETQQRSESEVMVTGVEEDIKTSELEPELIQQRDALYLKISDITTQLSQGQKPDLRIVSQLADEQYKLVKAQAVTTDEAIATLQFLRQVLPEMDMELAREIKRIEN
ncbi:MULTISPECIES: hypothetical protein [Acinetobacter]|uniref:hypothetical protein n=1 Tax=Acinetobacter TaxID=469 RepID=UPI0005376A73|nr:hypothetical protein [Acinetobacter sp. HR7]KGT47344.1 hypothetical protein GW12_17030 [Acinetobacter sp. HR7]